MSARNRLSTSGDHLNESFGQHLVPHFGPKLIAVIYPLLADIIGLMSDHSGGPAMGADVGSNSIYSAVSKKIVLTKIFLYKIWNSSEAQYSCYTINLKTIFFGTAKLLHLITSIKLL